MGQGIATFRFHEKQNKKKEEAKGTNRDNEEIKLRKGKTEREMLIADFFNFFLIKLRKGKTEREMLIADFFNKEEWINIDVDNLCVFADIGK